MQRVSTFTTEPASSHMFIHMNSILFNPRQARPLLQNVAEHGAVMYTPPMHLVHEHVLWSYINFAGLEGKRC